MKSLLLFPFLFIIFLGCTPNYAHHWNVGDVIVKATPAGAKDEYINTLYYREGKITYEST